MTLIMTGVASTGTSPLPMLGAVCSAPTTSSADPVRPGFNSDRSIGMWVFHESRCKADALPVARHTLKQANIRETRPFSDNVERAPLHLSPQGKVNGGAATSLIQPYRKTVQDRRHIASAINGITANRGKPCSEGAQKALNHSCQKGLAASRRMISGSRPTSRNC